MESNDWLEDNKSITRNSNNNLNKEENKEIIYDDINDAFDKIVKHYEERKKTPVISEIKDESVNKVVNEIKPKKNNTNKNIKHNKIKVNNNYDEYDDYDDYDDTYDDYYD